MRELSLHVLDIAQNSLDAGATRLDIALDEDPAADRLAIVVTDDGRGMDLDFAQNVLDPFATTRTTRRVGLGLALLEAAARRCAGHVSVQSRPGSGTRVEAIFQRSHIDRAPLGDMASTLLTLIVANPQVRLLYSHRVADWRFALDTAELRSILGEVPCSNPAVLRWLRALLAGDRPPRGEDIWSRGNKPSAGEGVWRGSPVWKS